MRPSSRACTVDLRTWFAGTYSASDDTTNRMLDWCNNGTTLLFVNGGNLIASAIDAAKETTSGNEVRVMASDYDQNDSSDLILGSAIKCYSSAVQQELYAFFSGNAAWDQTAAGQSEKVGYTTGAVALAGPHWRFAELSQHDYERLYDPAAQQRPEGGHLCRHEYPARHPQRDGGGAKLMKQRKNCIL